MEGGCMKHNPEEYFWNEKYRPTTINDVIVPERQKVKFETVLETGEIPGYIFSGKPGTGKTTIAKALCEELDLEYEVINASEKRGIGVIRDIVEDYGMTSSFNGKYKVIILDEGEKLTADAQEALKNPIEELQTNLRIIITTNNFNKIDSALISRLEHIEFDHTEIEVKEMFKPLLSRLFDIFDNEGVKYDKKNQKMLKYIAKILKEKCDIRHIVKSLQSIVNENGMCIPDDYDFPDNTVNYDNFIMMLKSEYEIIAKYADACDPNTIFTFIGRNILKFNKDMNIIRQLMNATVTHERNHLEKVDKINNMIAYFMNIKKILSI